MPNIKALGLVVSDKKIFSCLPYISLYKTYVSPGGPILGPRGIILNKLGRGPLGDASYQISRLKASWFQIRGFCHIFLY